MTTELLKIMVDLHMKENHPGDEIQFVYERFLSEEMNIEDDEIPDMIERFMNPGTSEEQGYIDNLDFELEILRFSVWYLLNEMSYEEIDQLKKDPRWNLLNKNTTAHNNS